MWIFFNISSSEIYNKDSNLLRFDKLKHRGIDNSSFIEIINKKIFLGHHRLSINDLDRRANQPMKSDCGNYHILFNGEIYNFNYLKKELNYNFKTTTDTEVILAGYKKIGKAFLKKIEGFFSILILDMRENKIVITVDPTSCKSVYYEKNKDFISIASELNSFMPTNSNNLINSISIESLKIYMQYGYIHAPYSILNNVFKVEPGELIEFNLTDFEVSHYKDFNKHFYKRDHRSIEDLLIESHKSRLMADVPIAKMLSSGVDSTCSNVIYSKILKNKENVYTLGIMNSSSDESKLASDQTRNLKLNHKIFMVTLDNIFNEFKYLSSYLDEPYADSSSILVSLLSKKISNKYKVVISSDGGDELLYGYLRHKFFFVFSWLCYLPKIIKNILNSLLSLKINNHIFNLLKIDYYEIKINKILSFLNQTNPKYAYLSLLKLIPDFIMNNLFKNYDGDELLKNFSSKYKYNSIKEIDYNFYLPSINYKNDRCGMHYSLEIREPFLNFNLVRHFFKKN